MLISVHVPKCAGTSFRHVLNGISADEGVWYNYGTIFSREQASLDLIPAGTRIIHGHFLADSFDDICPDRDLITWVRHPVERLVSNYHHCMRSPDMRDDCCRALHEDNLSLREYADLDWMQNMASRYLADKPVDDFRFVGVSEHFEASISIFEEALGFQVSGNMPRVNTNPDRRETRYRITLADHKYILRRNADDMAWYNEAVERMRGALVKRTEQFA